MSTDTLPFDPEDVPVVQLAERLEEVHDENLVHRLQRLDTRKTAAAVYERRVDELRSLAGPEHVPAPEPEPAPAEDRGYRVTRWHGRPNYECTLAPFSSLKEEEVQAFVARIRRAQR